MGDKKYPDRGLARQFMANVTEPVKNPDDFVLWPSKEKPGTVHNNYQVQDMILSSSN